MQLKQNRLFAGNFMAHHATFRDLMAGNFLAGDFLTRIRMVHIFLISLQMPIAKEHPKIITTSILTITKTKFTLSAKTNRYKTETVWDFDYTFEI